MIITEKELKKDYSKNKNTEKNEEEIKKFMVDFNRESEKRKLKWYAYMKFGEFLHIRRSGFFSDIDLQMTNSNFYFDFCDNDFICGPLGKRASEDFFKYIVGALPILKAIPQKIFILKDNSFSSLNKRLGAIELEVSKIGN